MKKTQTSDILQHLKDGRRLTQKEAINEYGAYRLSGIIYALRNQGHDIESIPLNVPTRYKKENGDPRMANVVEYKLGYKNNTQPLDRLMGMDEGFDARLNAFINSITQ
jgi:hypothetical protein